MKTPAPLVSALCVAWVFLGTPSSAQDPFAEKNPEKIQAPDGSEKQIRVQVEFIDVSHEQLTELMFGSQPAATDTELRQQVGQLVKDGKATIRETLVCTTLDGQKATSESIEEYIYPTEYEPAELPLEKPEKDDGKPPVSLKPVTDAIGPTPTAFETRNLGSTLEIEPKATADGKIIKLRFVPEIVYHIGNTIWAEWKGAHGNSPIQMPTMYTLRLNTTLTLGNGKPMLAGALSPKNDQGFPDPTRKLMVFVKATVLP